MSGLRLRVVVTGAVQGVGFRPFVWRLARELSLGGHVRNEGGAVIIEVEGLRTDEFLTRLGHEHPRAARVDHVAVEPCEPRSESAFDIRESHEGGRPDVIPDLATCPDCLHELLDPASRFHGYPFVNCTRCGPRYSIIERVPYDRAHTTMAAFAMCAACRAEYENPANRRFHAQPTACPACGPALSFSDAAGAPCAGSPLALAAAALREGLILAVKGLGGFQLLADATRADVVARLRQRKHRPDKPLAVMVRDLAAAQPLARISEAEAELLQSPAAPIVLVASKAGALAANVAPGLPVLGLMLPTTPLHHLLLRAVEFPVVCTSGNLSEEPLCIDNAEALQRLGVVADRFLLHNRPIRRALDDSVARVMDGAPQVLRLARGYAPLLLPMAGPPAMAVGAHLKNAPALCVEDRAIVGQHVGDLENTLAIDALRQTAADLRQFFHAVPEVAACDLHPDYGSTRFAAELGLPVLPVQHHAAHALACLAEHGLTCALAVVWDGAGLGPDGSIWGGEFLHFRGTRFSRVAHLLPFRLPSGDAAARDARRALAALEGAQAPAAPFCSSVGRLFDGFAALLGLCGPQSYEGQAAMLLEAAVAPDCDDAYELPLINGALDWRPMLAAARQERDKGIAAAKFHNALAEAIVAVARTVGEQRVALCGGCFQNRYLTERALRRLREAGFTPVIPRLVPPNDGAIALGQLAALTGDHDVPRRTRPH
ncbi:carbamoyltransferase HypF [bacterium]|nr:MAG: carbamoyltransferase HypF [bacterium]RIK64884.1 MAG: carbamoyltransferase HypF [Planctomycetota bacterium]